MFKGLKLNIKVQMKHFPWMFSCTTYWSYDCMMGKQYVLI